MANSAQEMLQNILNDPEAMNRISEMLGSINSEEESKEEKSGPFEFDDPEMIMKIGSMLGKISNTDDASVNLILALKPYLSEKRSESADRAVKLLKLSKLSSLIGDIDLF